jgi:hypothetical protein
MSVADSFDDVLPGAAKHASAFLGRVQAQCNQAGLGLALQPVQPDRKSQRIVMRAAVADRPAYSIEAYADPLGTALHVGWQLIQPDASTRTALTNFGSYMQNANANQLERMASDHNTVRILTGMALGFQKLVFLPVLSQLVDASSTQQGSGFLGVSAPRAAEAQSAPQDDRSEALLTAAERASLQAQWPKDIEEALEILAELPNPPANPLAWCDELCRRMRSGATPKLAAGKIPLDHGSTTTLRS